MVFYIIACRKEKADEGHVEQTIRGKVLTFGAARGGQNGALFSLTNGVNKNQFKCGSLDELMSLNDLFQKFELTIDGSCKRIEKIAFDLYNEVQSRADEKAAKPEFRLKISQQVPGKLGADAVMIEVDDYLKNFMWDTGHYAYDKTLSELGGLCLKAQKTSDDQVKAQMEKVNGLKQQLAAL